MLTELEKNWASDFLSGLDLEDLIDIARTSTSGLIHPTSINGAIKAILLHTEDPRSLLMRKKITKRILFEYLHKKNVSFPASHEKTTLVNLVLKLWKQNITNTDDGKLTNNLRLVSNQTVERIDEKKETIFQPVPDNVLESLGVKFSEWFYNGINSIVSQRLSIERNVVHEKLKEEDFWFDAKMFVKLTSGPGEIGTFTSEGAKECLALVNHICKEYSLFFSPNLFEEGTRTKSDPHGLVIVMNCGTLHEANSSNCVGLYEQVFGLIKDPLSANWKIKYNKLILRNENVTTTPKLPSNDQLSAINF